MNIIKLLINPDEFFKELSQKEGSLKMPFLIVSLLAIIVTIYAYYYTNFISGIYPSEMAGLKTLMVVSALVGAILGPYISWLLMSVIIYILSMIFGGEGTLKRVVEFVGYGFVPNIIGALITSLIGIYILSNVHVQPLSMSQMMDPQYLKMYIHSIIPKPYIYLNLIVNIAVTIWNLIIWTFGMKYALKLPLKKSLIVVGIPTLLFAVFTLLSIIQNL